MAKKIIKVAGVAIIDQDKNKVLAGKRNADRLVGGMWEFHGGKIEKGETPQEAAKRELKEEFHDEVQIGTHLDETVSYEYNCGIDKLTVFFAKLLTNNFDLVAHSEVEWLSADEVQKLNWAPADAPLVKELARTNFRDIKF